MSETISFKHAVGKSTLKEGFTIPKSAEVWASQLNAGDKAKVWLLFNGQRVQAVMRRLHNERGHIQIKYETRDGRPFRNWLISTFGTTPGVASGGYIQVTKVGTDVFEIIPFPAEAQLFPHLSVAQWLFHKDAEVLLESEETLSEIPAVVRTVAYDDDHGQNQYNTALSNSFSEWEWDSEGRVIPELGLKYDFAKNGVQVEVEFGNARTYYQDFIKFLIAYRRQTAHVGVLLVPTEPFAKHLCDIGRRRAIEKGGRCYSGMIHFNKVQREFRHLEFIVDMPLVIAGIAPE